MVSRCSNSTLNCEYQEKHFQWREHKSPLTISLEAWQLRVRAVRAQPQWYFSMISNVRHPSRELDFRLSGLTFHFVYVLFFHLEQTFAKGYVFSAFGKPMNCVISSVFKLLIYGCAVCGRLTARMILKVQSEMDCVVSQKKKRKKKVF